MQKVLLAINGISPDRRAFDFAIRLCKRIRAGLNILDIIGPENWAKYLGKVRRGTLRATKMVEDTMVAVAFAEAGEFDSAACLKEQALKNIHEWLPEPEEAGIPCDLTITSGPPAREIMKYIEDHKDVVLTIYDAPAQKMAAKTSGAERQDVLDRVKEKLFTPIVMMRE